jgi:hypothetical protein
MNKFKTMLEDIEIIQAVKKHGTHDQKTHGSWADGYTDEEISRMEELEDVGPSIQDLEDVLSGEGQDPGYDELKMMVENDQGLYKEAIDGIEERVAALVEENKYEYADQEAADAANEALYNRLFEQEQEKMINEFIENSGPGELAGLWIQQNGGGSGDPETLLPSFGELYDMSHEVRNAQGEVVTVMTSEVKIAEFTTDTPSGDVGIYLRGQIKDSAGNQAGDFIRIFYKEDDVWMVEHKLLKLQDDYENLGFGKDFIQKSMDWYAQRGMGAVIVGTAWDGARHWARAGFDFNPYYRDSDFQDLVDRMVDYEDFEFGTPARAEFDAIMRRATNGYVSDDGGAAFDSIKDMTSDDFPLPNDFAMIGFKDKTSTPYVHPITQDRKTSVSWSGERLLSDMNLNYIQILTPEGRSLIDGPIDRDGDGMVFDGTAREKPVSAVNS